MSLFNRIFGDARSDPMPADVNAPDEEGRTPLHWAATSEHKRDERRVKELIAAGANANTQNIHGRTPLMAAVAADSAENVKALIDAGADVNVRDKYGETALFWSKSERVSALLKAAGTTH